MPNGKSKRFDLEDRAFAFAKDVRTFVRQSPRTVCNQEDARQLVRSSGSTGANYIEANCSLGKKEFVMRIRISRKEAKESTYWLRLLETQGNEDWELERNRLVQESEELMKIFGSILKKSLPAERV